MVCIYGNNDEIQILKLYEHNEVGSINRDEFDYNTNGI